MMSMEGAYRFHKFMSGVHMGMAISAPAIGIFCAIKWWEKVGAGGVFAISIAAFASFLWSHEHERQASGLLAKMMMRRMKGEG